MACASAPHAEGPTLSAQERDILNAVLTYEATRFRLKWHAVFVLDKTDPWANPPERQEEERPEFLTEEVWQSMQRPFPEGLRAVNDREYFIGKVRLPAGRTAYVIEHSQSTWSGCGGTSILKIERDESGWHADFYDSLGIW